MRKVLLSLRAKNNRWIHKGILEAEATNFTGQYIEPYLCDDMAATREYLDDPEICHTMSPVEIVKAIKTNALALQNKAKMPADLPVLIVAGKVDKIYKASAIPAFAEGMGSKRKKVEIMPKRGHLLIESPRVQPAVLSIIDDFLKTDLRTASNDARATTADASVPSGRSH